MATEIIKEFEMDLVSLTLFPSDGGKFEVELNDELIYSKLQTHRHAEPGEIVTLVRKKLREVP